jgi:ribonuclease T2
MKTPSSGLRDHQCNSEYRACTCAKAAAVAQVRNITNYMLSLAGLLLLCVLSGCRDTAQPSAASQPDPAVARQSSSAHDYEGEPRHGRRRSRRGHAETQATPGVFDFYLFNLSWSPEFCATHASSPECGHGLGLVVHGMWPQDNSGDYPEDCSDAPGPANPGAYTDIVPTVSLVEHEWQTHGTCSGMAPDAYFAAERQAFAAFKIPADIGTARDVDGVNPEDLVARLAKANPNYPQGSIAISCGNNRLTAVEVCLSKSLVPETCQGVRSCRANLVKIAPR